MKKLNNKGYMLIEIILASVLAFGVAYFIIDLTIKLKNKNDDLVVETQTVTDQTIIYNGIMKHINNSGFDCTKIKIDNQKITYNNELIDIVNDYAKIGSISCEEGKITIPITVKQIPDKNFNVAIYYNK